MLIKTLNINNLRNLKSVDMTLNPQLNYLLGSNGAGKTSVLESIVVLAKGRSFRSGQIDALLGPDGELLRVVATTKSADEHNQTLGIERSRSQWKARRNGEDVKQLSDLAIHLPLVLIEPNSHLLVSGPPEGRRRFLDWGVFHVEPDYLVQWRRYSRALKQRNAALRRRDGRLIDSIDEVLSELGESVDSARRTQADRLSPMLERTVEELSPELEDISLRYEKGWRAEKLSLALQSSRQRDLERGSTGPGPHKADLSLYVGKKPAKERLSRGEQKVLAASLLLSQGRLMVETGETPLLLMDDLASEFDEAHLSTVLEAGRNLQCQIWITGTSVKPYESMMGGEYAMFHVEHGTITEKTNI